MQKSLVRTALVTGGNRGLGRETVRQLAQKGLKVVASYRDAAHLPALQTELPGVTWICADLSDAAGVETLIKALRESDTAIDVLVNNAGVFLDYDADPTGSVWTASRDTITATFNTNTLAPFQLCQALVPGMLERGFGRVVNLSSGMGQLDEMEGGTPAYRISKTALNAVTKIFAAEVAGQDVCINSMCPGWVKTDMGGANAERSIPEGADTIVWLATLPTGSTNGGFFRDREPIAW